MTIIEHRERVERFDKLKAQGMTIEQIAEAMNDKPSCLLPKISNSRKVLGIQPKKRVFPEGWMLRVARMKDLGARFDYITNLWNYENPRDKVTRYSMSKAWYRWDKKRKKKDDEG